jgi:hypothetical protein
MVDFQAEHENTHHAGGKNSHGRNQEDEEEGHDHYGGGRAMRCDHQ